MMPARDFGDFVASNKHFSLLLFGIVAVRAVEGKFHEQSVRAWCLLLSRLFRDTHHEVV